MSIFHSDKVLINHISEADLKVYFIGYEFKNCRYDEFVSKVMNAIVEFSFGFHEGIIKSSTNHMLAEAAKSVYKIDSFNKVKWVYVDNDSLLSEEDLINQNNYLRKGEFGELILHVLLRDFMNTVPLLSKIHFKDTDGFPVHGFDSVHIGQDLYSKKASLFLGESKLYSREKAHAGKAGIDDLLTDIKEHFKKDFLQREFSLIGKKKRYFIPLDEYNDKNTFNNYTDFIADKDYWFQKIIDVEKGNEKLETFLDSVTIPILCTYQSNFMEKHDDENSKLFKKELDEEVSMLQEYFITKLKKIEVEKGEPIRTNLNILLMLFPIPSKKELVKRMHEKLFCQQRV